MARRGNIERLGENRFRIRISMGKNPDGSRKVHREIVHGDEDAAERRLAEVLHEIYSGGYVESKRITLAEHMERWLSTWVEASDRSEKTVASYREAMKHILPELGHVPLQKLSAPMIQAYFKRKLTKGRRDGKGGLSPTTVHGHYRTLHAALEVAVRWGLVARNVCDLTNPPQPIRKTRKRRKWTNEEVARFLEHIQGHRLYAMYVLCLTCGFRRGEVTALRWQDIDLERLIITPAQSIITVGNTQKIVERLKSEESENELEITEAVRDILLDHAARQAWEKQVHGSRYEDHGLVFCQPNGRPLWVANLSRRQFPALCQQAGVTRIRFHDLRHTYANYLIEQGHSITVVQRRMRHTRASTTLDMYGHASDEAVIRAAHETDALLPRGTRAAQNGGELRKWPAPKSRNIRSKGELWGLVGSRGERGY